MSQNNEQPTFAILSRNYPEHLKAAEAHHSSQWIPFRSEKVWKKAHDILKDAIDNKKPKPLVYFLQVGDSDGYVKYVATLEDVILNPKEEDVNVQNLLKKCVRTTEKEEFWGKTLYVVSNCRKVEKEQIKFTELEKLSDRKKVDPNFGYSYAIVQAHPDLK